MTGDLADLLIMLERAVVQNATAFCVVTTDSVSGDVFSTCGPFDEAEQALVEAGRMDAIWRGQAETQVEADALRYVVVAQWEPTA